MLPELKDDFPKLLYLDQNKWIDLSRAHYGHPKGKPFHDALDSVREAVRSGKLIVPFSAVNIVEMTAHHISERRERLARFMVDLSRNCTILPFMPVRAWEIQRAVHSFYGRPEPGSIRRSIVREGIDNALGIRLRVSGLFKEDEVAVLQLINSAETSLQFLLASGDNRELTDQMRTEEAAVLVVQERVRARSAVDEISWNQRWAAELTNYLYKGDVGKVLVIELQKIGSSIQTFFGKFTSGTEFRQFFASIHTLEVALTLMLARDKDLVREIPQNDTRDLIGLSVAIPYGNLVVSEKYWCRMARWRRLDKEYRTTIITDARELPSRLAEMGCL